MLKVMRCRKRDAEEELSLRQIFDDVCHTALTELVRYPAVGKIR